MSMIRVQVTQVKMTKAYFVLKKQWVIRIIQHYKYKEINRFLCHLESSY